MYTLSKINSKHTQSVFERLSHFTHKLCERICKIMKPAHLKRGCTKSGHSKQTVLIWGDTNLNIDMTEPIHLVQAKCV